MKTMRPRGRSLWSACSEAMSGYQATSAVMPSAGVATLLPRATISSVSVTGAIS